MSNLKSLLNEDQDQRAVEKIVEKVNGILTNGELIEYIAVQKKPAINLSPDCIALTNKRVIFCMPKNFGFGMNFSDILWKDVHDCHMSEGLLGATFTLRTLRGASFMMDYLPKNQARKLYQFAQAKEEEMIEFRRNKDLEDKRAAAGGGIVVNTAQQTPQQLEKNIEDPLASLQKLKTLLENDLISNEEFESKKSEILARL